MESRYTFGNSRAGVDWRYASSQPTDKEGTKFRSRPVIVIAGALAWLSIATVAWAVDLGSSYRGRGGKTGITLQPRYVLSKDIDAEGGSKLELDPAYGFGLGRYNPRAQRYCQTIPTRS